MQKPSPAEKQNSSGNENLEITIPIVTNSEFDLSKLDFSFLGVKIYEIRDPNLKEYCEKLDKEFHIDSYSWLEELIETSQHQYDRPYAIIKENYKEFNYSDVFNIYKLLLIIHPSEFQVEFEIIIYRNEKASSTYFTKHQKTETGKFLSNRDSFIPEINEFAKSYFHMLKKDNFVGMAIRHYLTSFNTSHLHYQFLTLCIALETLVYGSIELSYRLKRTVAILCGSDNESSQIIFDNLNQIYKLRSKITHGEKFSEENIITYLEPLQAIVSRALIEIIIHNLVSTEALDKKITQIGFGERHRISDNWKHFELNERIFGRANWLPLEK